MFSRYFLALSAVLLLAALVSCDPVEEKHDEAVDEVSQRNPALILAVRVLKAAFKWAAKHCLEEAANNCKQHWKHPKELVKCAKGFLESNKGRCVAG